MEIPIVSESRTEEWHTALVECRAFRAAIFSLAVSPPAATAGLRAAACADAGCDWSFPGFRPTKYWRFPFREISIPEYYISIPEYSEDLFSKLP